MTNWDKLWKNKLNKILIKLNIKGNYYLNAKLAEEIVNGRKFDTIICGELIEHLENPYQFLHNIYNLLADSGKLILSTPNPMGFPVFICEFFQIKKFFYASEHTYYFLPR